MYRCKKCNTKSNNQDLVLTVDSNGEWILHCPKCNSEMLELANEICGQSPHSLKTYYELEDDL